MAKSLQKPVSDAAADKAIRRAIRKTDLTHEPPTVGKPVIIDPAEEKAATRAGKKKSEPSC